MKQNETDGKTAAGQEVSRPRRKNSLSKILPTGRISFAKQLEILRAFVVASETAGGKAISNGDAGALVDMAGTTVMMTNAFFCDIGLLNRVEGGLDPSPEAISYQKAHGWNASTAGAKLAPAIERTWFAQVVIPRLKCRPLAESDAVQVLAETASAETEHAEQIKSLIEYMVTAGILSRDGGQLSLVQPVGQATPMESSEGPPVSGGENIKPELRKVDVLPANNGSDEWDEYTLVLEAEKKRRIVVRAPHTITAAELERIRAWLGFQLIIQPAEVVKPKE